MYMHIHIYILTMMLKKTKRRVDFTFGWVSAFNGSVRPESFSAELVETRPELREYSGNHAAHSTQRMANGLVWQQTGARDQLMIRRGPTSKI